MTTSCHLLFPACQVVEQDLPGTCQAAVLQLIQRVTTSNPSLAREFAALKGTLLLAHCLRSGRTPASQEVAEVLPGSVCGCCSVLVGSQLSLVGAGCPGLELGSQSEESHGDSSAGQHCRRLEDMAQVSVCVCVCVYARARARVCVCVCMRVCVSVKLFSLLHTECSTTTIPHAGRRRCGLEC